MPVGIVGDRGSGKSVFVSLLAKAARDYSNRTDGEKFRTFVSSAFAQKTGSIVASLTNGSWPSATLKGTLSQYKFAFGYRKPLTTTLRMKLFNKIDFSIFDIAGEDVALIKQISNKLGRDHTLNLVDELPDNLKQILDCNILVFLIDASKITIEKRTKRSQDMQDYDTVMATLIALVTQYKRRSKKQSEKTAKLYPIFVITKTDAIAPNILEAIGVPRDFALKGGHNFIMSLAGGDRKERQTYASALMKEFFPFTLSQIRGSRLYRVDYDDAKYFFSQLKTEMSEDGLPVPTLKSTKGEIIAQLDYSEDEYMLFIDHLGEIAKKAPDKEEEL